MLTNRWEPLTMRSQWGLSDELLDSDGHSDIHQLEIGRYGMNLYGKKLKDGDKIWLTGRDGTCTPGWYTFKSKGCIDDIDGEETECWCTPCFHHGLICETVEDLLCLSSYVDEDYPYLCMVEQAICEGLI